MASPFPPPLPFKMESMRGPAYTNWVLRGHLLMGPHPGQISTTDLVKNLTEILKAGVTTFVCLQPEMPSPKLSGKQTEAGTPGSRLRSAYGGRNVVSATPFIDKAQIIVDHGGPEFKQTNPLSFVHFPIPDTDGATVKEALLKPFLLNIIAYLKAGEMIYIQCGDGNGKSGTVCAILLGLLYNLSSSEALDACQRYRDHRTGAKGYAPDTHDQKMQVHKILRDREFRNAARDVVPRPSGDKAEEEADDVNGVLTGLRKQLGRQGHYALLKFERNLKPGMTLYELGRTMTEFGIRLNDPAVELLYRNHCRDGVFDPRAFVNSVTGRLSAERARLVEQAFGLIDVHNLGAVSMEDVAGLYLPKGHPIVQAGKMTEEAASREFLDMFPHSGRGDVGLDHFYHFYAKVSAAVSDDKAFQMLLWRSWPFHAKRPAGSVAPPRTPDRAGSTVGASSYAGSISGLSGAAVPSAAIPAGNPITHLRRALVDGKASVSTLVALAASLHAEAGGGGRLPIPAFVDCFRRVGVGLPRAHLQAAVSAVADGSTGTADVQFFLQALRGKLPKSRRRLVLAAFERLDTSGVGKVPLTDILSQFRAEKHPAVAAGKRTPEAVYSEFMTTFPIGLEAGAPVLLPHFEAYFEAVSCTMEDDAYFKLFMWNVWGLGGRATPKRGTPVKSVFNADTVAARTTTRQEGFLGTMERLAHTSARPPPSPYRAGQRAHYADHPAVRTSAAVVGAEAQPLFSPTHVSRGGVALGPASAYMTPSKAGVSGGGGGGSGDPLSPSNRMRDLTHSAPRTTAPRREEAILGSPVAAAEQALPRTPRHLDTSDAASATVGGYTRTATLSPRSDASRPLYEPPSAMPTAFGVEAAFDDTDPITGEGRVAGTIGSGGDPYRRRQVGDGDHLRMGRDRGRRAYSSKTFSSSVPWDDRDTSMTSDAEVKNLRERFRKHAATPPPPPRPRPGSREVVDEAGARQSHFEKLKEHLRRTLAKRGARGIIGLGRAFRIMDDDGSKTLNMYEFAKGMRDFGLPISTSDLEVLFDNFDRDGNGSVDYNEFLRGVRGPLSSMRRELIAQAYRKLDANRNGIVDVDDIRIRYNAKHHPDVKSGKKSEADILREFLDTFDSTSPDGQVTFDEFLDYYANVSSSIDDDNYFQLMMWNAWGLQSGVPDEDREPERKVVFAKAGGFTAGLMKQSIGEVYRGGGTRGSTLGGAHGSVVYGGEGAGRSMVGSYTGTAGAAGATAGGLKSGLEGTDVESILERLRHTLGMRGANGLVGLGRSFRIMDDDGSKTLKPDEFAKAMRDVSMGLSDIEVRAVFKRFDRDGNGRIDYEEFLQGVRGKINEFRLDLVRKAFQKMDVDGNGYISVEDIATKYNAKESVAVKSGKKTEREVLGEFLNVFDGTDRDGRVTWPEWVQYYTTVSASIDDDAYFQLVMWSSWDLSEKRSRRGVRTI